MIPLPKIAPNPQPPIIPNITHHGHNSIPSLDLSNLHAFANQLNANRVVNAGQQKCLTFEQILRNENGVKPYVVLEHSLDILPKNLVENLGTDGIGMIIRADDDGDNSFEIRLQSQINPGNQQMNTQIIAPSINNNNLQPRIVIEQESDSFELPDHSVEFKVLNPISNINSRVANQGLPVNVEIEQKVPGMYEIEVKDPSILRNPIQKNLLQELNNLNSLSQNQANSQKAILQPKIEIEFEDQDNYQILQGGQKVALQPRSMGLFSQGHKSSSVMKINSKAEIVYSIK